MATNTFGNTEVSPPLAAEGALEVELQLDDIIPVEPRARVSTPPPVPVARQVKPPPLPVSDAAVNAFLADLFSPEELLAHLLRTQHPVTGVLEALAILNDQEKAALMKGEVPLGMLQALQTYVQDLAQKNPPR